MTELTERKLSLFDIEVGWIPLLEARADAEAVADPAERQAAIESADLALAEHVGAEVQKADGVIGFSRFLESIVSAAKAEASRQQRRAQVAENILKQIKANVLFALQSSGKKRIDGTRGALTIKGNGGVAPLVITDESLLPDECCRMEGWISAEFWEHLLSRLDSGGCREVVERYSSLKRVPDGAAIRAKLLEDCEACAGSGTAGDYGAFVGECQACGGTGKNAAPGAYLGERGAHVEIR